MANAEEFILKLNQQVSGPADAATEALNKLQSQVGGATAALGAVGAAAAVAGIKLRGINGQFISKEALAALAQAIPGFDSLGEAAKKSALAEKAVASGLISTAQAAKAAEAAIKAKAKAEAIASKADEKQAANMAKDSLAYDKHMRKMADSADKVAKRKVAQKPIDASLEASKGVGILKDNIPQLDGMLGRVQGALEKLGPKGQAVAAAFAVLAAAAIVLVGTFLKVVSAAISISQEKDALSATFKALSTGTESGKELVDSLSEVAAALPFAEGKVLAWGKSLMSAGIEGEKLTSAVNAVAAATALMGEEGGQAAESMIKQLAAGGDAADSLIKTVQGGGKKAAVQLAAMGLQADDLARALGVTPEKMKTMALTAEQLGAAIEKAVTEKGAGAIEAMGLTWDSIKGKLSDGAEDLFEDLGAVVKPFMMEVRSLFAEFFAGTTTMSTVKDVITAVLTEVFSVATKVVNFLHKGFLVVEIAAFKVIAAMWPIISVIVAIATNATMLRGIVIVLKLIALAVAVMIAPFAILSALFFAVGVAVYVMAAAVVSALAWCVGVAADSIGQMIGWLGSAGSAFLGFASTTWGLVKDLAASVWAVLTGMGASAYEAAAGFIGGILAGIGNGVGAVVAAVQGLASAAMSAFTGFFKIRSPSQLMADTAIHIPAGAAEGIEAGTGDVAGAMEDMGDAGMGGAAKGFGKGGAKKSGSGGDINVVIHYSGTREDFPDFETRLAEAFEKLRGLAPRTT